MIDVLQSDYVRAARLKGLPERTVLFRHALRNALLPVVTIVALDVGYLLGGIIVVEEIFALPGIGRALIVAIDAARPAGDPGGRADHGRRPMRSPIRWPTSPMRCSTSASAMTELFAPPARGRRRALLGIVLLALVAVTCVFGPVLAPYEPERIDFLGRFRRPAAQNLARRRPIRPRHAEPAAGRRAQHRPAGARAPR